MTLIPERANLEATMAMNTKGFQEAIKVVTQITRALADYNQQVQALTRARRTPGGGRVGVVGPGGVGATADITGGAGKRTTEYHRGMDAVLRSLNEAIQKNVQLLAKSSKAWEKNAKSVRKAAEQTRNVKKATDQSRFALTRAQFQLRQFGRTLYFAGRDLMMFGAILTGVMGYIIKTFADVEEQISRVEIRLQIMGKTAEDAHRIARELAGAAIKVGKEWGYGAREATRALASLASAGITATNAINILKQATILARINFISMDQATEVLVQYLKATGRTAKDAEVAIKELTVAQNNSFESLTSLAAGFGFAMTSLMEYGAASEDVAVAMTVFTKTGTSSTVAGRRLSSMYGHLTENGRKYGIQVKDAAGKTLEMKDMMLAVRERAEFFGDEMIRQQFLLEVLGITGKDAYEKMIKAIEAGEWDKMLDEFENTQVEAGALADVVRDDLKVAIDQLVASVEDLLTALGGVLAPDIKLVAGVLADIADAVRDFDEALGPVARGLVGAGVSATILGGVFTALGMIIATAVGFWAGLAKHMKWVKGLSLSVVAIIVMLVGAFVGFMDAMEVLTKDNEDFANALKAVGGVLDYISRIIEPIVKILFQLGRALGIAAAYSIALVGALGGLAVEFLEGSEEGQALLDLLGEFAAALEMIPELLEWIATYAELVNDAMLGSDEALQKLLAHIEPLKDVIRGFIEALGFLAECFEWIKLLLFGESPGVISGMILLKDLFLNIVSPIENFASALSALLGGGPLELAKGVLSAIKDTLEWLQENTKFDIEINVDLVGAGADILKGAADTAGEGAGLAEDIITGEWRYTGFP